MLEAMVVTHVVLWIVVIALVIAVLALARQIGVLHERIAPMGALMMDAGPKVGDTAPVFELEALGGERLALGAPGAKSTLLFFIAPTCPVCKKLLPIIGSIREAEKRWLSVVLASDAAPGEHAEHQAFRRRAGIESYPYVLSTELGMTWRVSKLPYAVLLDETGRVRAKGLVNSREQLESLFTARELGVASVQEYVSRQAVATPGGKHA